MLVRYCAAVSLGIMLLGYIGTKANPIPVVDPYSTLECERADSIWGSTTTDTAFVGLGSASGVRFDHLGFPAELYSWEPFPYTKRHIGFRAANGAGDTARFAVTHRKTSDGLSVFLGMLLIPPTGNWDTFIEASCSLMVAPEGYGSVTIEGQSDDTVETARLDWICFVALPRVDLDFSLVYGGWIAGCPHEIRWRSHGPVDTVRIDFALNDSSPWMTIADNLPNTGSYYWSVPDTTTDDARLRLFDSKAGYQLGPESSRFAIVRYQRDGFDTIPFLHADVTRWGARKDFDSAYLVAGPASDLVFTNVNLGAGAKSLQFSVARPKTVGCTAPEGCRACTLEVTVERVRCLVPLACTPEVSFSTVALNLDTTIAGWVSVRFRNPYARTITTCELGDSLYFRWLIFSDSATSSAAGHADFSARVRKGELRTALLDGDRLLLAIGEGTFNDGLVRIRVHGLDGRLVYDETIVHRARGLTTTMQLPALAEGTYAISVEGAGRRVKRTAKIVR